MNDRGCRLWHPTGGLTAQVGWLGLTDDSRGADCIHRTNQEMTWHHYKNWSNCCKGLFL